MPELRHQSPALHVRGRYAVARRLWIVSCTRCNAVSCAPRCPAALPTCTCAAPRGGR